MRSASSAPRPAARQHLVRLEDSTLAPLSGALALVERLRLSTRAPIAALVRAALWRGAASSPTALGASVDRYRKLLLHARDAAGAGRTPDRRMLRELTDGLDDQLLLWDLLDSASGVPDLVPDDLPALAELHRLVSAAARGPDSKVERLSDLLADGRSTLVFTVARETVRYLRDRLPGPVAWCTGERAGIGRQPLPRQAVLDWFRPAGGSAARMEGLAPRHLIATDVAAEGLDLHRAQRVIHYDLPWTPARMDQREGRARRAGSAHTEVEVIRFDPPPMVEARLRQLACLAGKRRLPAAVGLDEPGRTLWRWRADLAERFRELPATEGVALSRDGPAGILAGFSLHAWPAAGGPLASHVLWWEADSGWTEDADIVTARLEAVVADAGLEQPADPSAHELPAEGVESPAGEAVEAALGLLAAPIRQRMGELRRSRWLGAHSSAAAHGLVSRLQALARSAARRRDAAALDRLHRAIGFAAGGHTAGERAWIAQLAGSSDRALESALASFPAPSPQCDALHARLTGLLIFQPR